MKPSHFVSSVISSVQHIIDKLTTLNVKLKIKLPGETVSPFSMIFTGFILITIALIINVIIRYITILQLIENPYLNLGVYFILTQIIAFCVVGGIVILFKGIDHAVKRL